MKKIFFMFILLSFLVFFIGCSKIQTKVDINNKNNISNDNDTNQVNLANVKKQNNEKSAQKILKKFDLNKIIVIINNNKILVGAKFKNSKKIRNIEKTKKEIEKSIIQEYGYFEEVVVIITENLVDRLDKLANDLKEKKPIEGLFEEMDKVVKEMYPLI